MRGVIARYYGKFGYGFIGPSASRDDLYFRMSDLAPDVVLYENEPVEFEVVTGQDGRLCAKNIRVL
jgi:cold shock CspA family protein